MMQSESFFVRMLPQAAAVVLTPKSKTYGSLELQKLDKLRRDLSEFQPWSMESLVVDLTGVVQHGSAFLAVLIELAIRLRRTGTELIVCGDQTGLLELIGGQKWCSLVTDLPAALDHSAGLQSVS